MAAKKKQLDFTKDPPENLTDKPFYGLVLDDEQLAFANAIWDPNIDIVFANAKAGSGKAQPVDTIIPTPLGNRRLGDIRPGNYVYARNGMPTKVLGVFKQGMLDAYEITLSDGRKTLCNGEHLWTYFGCSGHIVTETLNSMLHRDIKMAKSGYRYGIPINEPVYHDEKELPVDPYVVGAFIGDGCCTERSLTISSDDEDVVERIAKSIGSPKYKRYQGANYSWKFELPDELKTNRAKLFATKDVFKDIPCMIGDSYEKRIPSMYLNAGYEQRMELLRGLMDTDGCIVEGYSGSGTKQKYSVSYSTVSKGIIEDVTNLIRGLGYVCKVSEDYRDKYRYGVCYSLRFVISNKQKKDLFWLKRKRDIAERAYTCDDFRYYDRVWITDIKKLDRKMEMMCIYVDNDEHLYLTNDYIVTHNTTIAVGVANMLVQYGKFDEIYYIVSPYGERKQGFIPGSQSLKSIVYADPLFQALATIGVNPNTAVNTDGLIGGVSNQEFGGYITFLTDTYIRGTTIGDRKILLADECQNMSKDQLQKTLTRVGKGSKVICIGHTGQIDLDDPKSSGFASFIRLFSNQERCAICELHTNHRSWISAKADTIDEFLANESKEYKGGPFGNLHPAEMPTKIRDYRLRDILPCFQSNRKCCVDECEPEIGDTE